MPRPSVFPPGREPRYTPEVQLDNGPYGQAAYTVQPARTPVVFLLSAMVGSPGADKWRAGWVTGWQRDGVRWRVRLRWRHTAQADREPWAMFDPQYCLPIELDEPDLHAWQAPRPLG